MNEGQWGADARVLASFTRLFPDRLLDELHREGFMDNHAGKHFSPIPSVLADSQLAVEEEG